MLFITQRLQAYFLKITSGRWPPFTSMHWCKRVWKLPYTRLRRSSSIAATSFQFLNSHDTPPEHTVFQEPPQEKIWYSNVGRPSRPSDVAETRDNSSEHCCTFQRSIATDHTKWCPFLFPPTTISYRAGEIFKFEMCQSAPRHPVHLSTRQSTPVLILNTVGIPTCSQHLLT